MTGTLPFRNKRILVTGAGGFIGSHLVEALVAQGAHVRAMLRYTSRADCGNLEFAPLATRKPIEFIRGDVRDAHFMLRAAEGMDVIFHLAALIGIPYSYQAPAEYVSTNITGTLNVLEAARIQRVSRVMHTSTSETYGTAQYRPIDERHPVVGQSPYSATKIAADKLAESYHRSFDVPVVIVRPFNTYGPRQSARAIIPTILSQLLVGASVPDAQRSCALRLGSLKPLRDLTFVTDTVAGMLALTACDKAVGQTVNLGTGKAHSIGQIARACMSVAKRKLPIEQDPGRMRPAKSEVMALISNNSLARRLSGWRPRTELADGLAACAAFVQQHPELFRPEEYQQ